MLPNLSDEKEIVLSKKENEILNDCTNCGNYFFSLPLSILCGSLMFGAQKKGWISDLNTTKSKWINKLPKFLFRNRTFHGILLGYILGQIIYINSSDCEERFLKDDPDGVVARIIRQRRDELSYVANQDIFVDNDSTKDEDKEQNDKIDELLRLDPYVNTSYLADYRDTSNIDWFSDSEIKIPDKYKK